MKKHHCSLPSLSFLSLSLIFLSLPIVSHCNPCTLIGSDPYLFHQAFLFTPFPSLTCSSYTVHQLLEHCMFIPSPRPLQVLFSPLQCSIFIPPPFFRLINVDSLFTSHLKSHFFRPDSQPKSAFFVMGSH